MCPNLSHIILFSDYGLPHRSDINPYYVCPRNCGRKYKYKSGLMQHLKYECGVEQKFTCSICRRKFSHRFHLKNHTVAVHKMIIWSIFNYFLFVELDIVNYNIDLINVNYLLFFLKNGEFFGISDLYFLILDVQIFARLCSWRPLTWGKN